MVDGAIETIFSTFAGKVIGAPALSIVKSSEGRLASFAPPAKIIVPAAKSSVSTKKIFLKFFITSSLKKVFEGLSNPEKSFFE